MAYLYLFPHTRRQSTAAGASDSRRSVDPLSSCWPRMHQNTVRWLHSYTPIRITAATQPIRAQRLHRLLTKRSNHDPETLRMTVVNGLCKVHFLLIKQLVNELTLSFSIVCFLAQSLSASNSWLEYQWRTGVDVSQWPYWSDMFCFPG